LLPFERFTNKSAGIKKEKNSPKELGYQNPASVMYSKSRKEPWIQTQYEILKLSSAGAKMVCREPGKY
jgi:hypothetical protein